MRALTVAGDLQGEIQRDRAERRLEDGDVDRPGGAPGQITDESLVDVSVSTLTQLKVSSTTRRNTASRSMPGRSASVNKNEMCVAMSGSIIPTPLAVPTTRAVLPQRSPRPAWRRCRGHHCARRAGCIV